MKTKIAIILSCVALLIFVEYGISDGLNFANPYGRVPALWIERAPLSSLATWIGSGFILILSIADYWKKRRT